MQKAIDMLSEVKESIINAYELRTGQDRKTLAKLMESETWMNAKKAVELHFADDIIRDDSKEPAEAPAYAFSAKTADANLINKIQQKSKATAPQGRKVSDLKNNLYKSLL